MPRDRAPQRNQPRILLGADNDAWRHQLVDALDSNRLAHSMETVKNADAYLAHLERAAAAPGPDPEPVPNLLILAFSEQSQTGNLDILKYVKGKPELRFIPVIVATGRHRAMETMEAYELGANSVIHLPIRFEAMVRVMRILEEYWCHTAHLPPST